MKSANGMLGGGLRVTVQVEIEYPEDYPADHVLHSGTTYAKAIETLVRTGKADNGGCGPGVFVTSGAHLSSDKARIEELEKRLATMAAAFARHTHQFRTSSGDSYSPYPSRDDTDEPDINAEGKSNR